MPDFAREIFVSFIRLHVLHHAAHAPIYGVEMLEELQRHGYRMSPGTLYPVLHQLQAQGYLECERRVIAGKARKYYRTTELGRQVLEAARPKIRELMEEVLEDARGTEGGRNAPA
ncbi:MAG: PadR family transcriptional regulator [Chthonomonadales bacterium]